jgi:hypothetical protein
MPTPAVAAPCAALAVAAAVAAAVTAAVAAAVVVDTVMIGRVAQPLSPQSPPAPSPRCCYRSAATRRMPATAITRCRRRSSRCHRCRRRHCHPLPLSSSLPLPLPLSPSLPLLMLPLLSLTLPLSLLLYTCSAARGRIPGAHGATGRK